MTSAIDLARSATLKAEQDLKDFKDALVGLRRKEWLAAGGCEKCHGSGSIVVWGTLDSMTGCYDEFGTCPACEGKGPVWYGSNTGRRSGHPKVKVPDLCVSEAEEVMIKTLKKLIRDAKAEESMVIARHKVRKGSEVKIARGRKGTGKVGMVFWMSEEGDRVGVKTTPKADPIWTMTKHCDVTKPMTEEEVAQEARAKSVRRYVMDRAYKGATVESPKVKGKISWCGRIKRGRGPWRAVVEVKGEQFWLTADEITKVGGYDVSVATGWAPFQG